MIIGHTAEDARRVLLEMAASIRLEIAQTPLMPAGERIDFELNATSCEWGARALENRVRFCHGCGKPVQA